MIHALGVFAAWWLALGVISAAIGDGLTGSDKTKRDRFLDSLFCLTSWPWYLPSLGEDDDDDDEDAEA